MSKLPTAKEEVTLQLLTEHPSLYGLEMVAKSEGKLRRGTIYVTLARLEEYGLVSSELKSPPKGQRGPDRRIYSITTEGKQVFAATKRFSQSIIGLQFGS